MHKIFGIRHHGPGSARSLLKALDAFQPDYILIEMPQDAEGVLKYVSNKGLRAPVALMIYNPNDLGQAAYYPFADFSPEWQTIHFAQNLKIPVRLMDLPMSMQFSLDEKDKEKLLLQFTQPEQDWEDKLLVTRDPLSYLATLAGYTDSERWWEVTFEQTDHEAIVFEALMELMTALRSELKRIEDPRTLLREAFMRKTMRKAVKDGFQKIAVVCGAWHAPVLDQFLTFKSSTDNALLKGIKKTKVSTTWIPWTYNRLAFQSGYKAGIISPAWYELLFHQREEVIIRWMIRVALLFREKDLDASSAHVVEAVRLAETLAILRKRPMAGMEELEEAAVTIFGKGTPASLQLIREELIIGKKVGEVPPEVPTIPLQKDLEKRISTAKMRKYWGREGTMWLKETKSKPRGGIDLREASDLQKSHLLHQLNILKIRWGEQFEVSKNDIGSFKELWRLNWQPEFALQIIEAGMWGNTVLQAATNYARNEAKTAKSLPELTILIREVLQADLASVIDPLIRRLQELTALAKDVLILMQSLPDLVQIILYGDTRKTDISAVAKLVDELIPRISIGLPNACFQIEEGLAQSTLEQIHSVHHSINLLNNAEHFQHWYKALLGIVQSEQAHPLIQGAATRMLFDKGQLNDEATSTYFQRGLSTGSEVFHAALWVEGFLSGSGLLLIHHLPLWQILDEWIDQLPEEIFHEILPLLRRTFSNFSGTERQKMLEQAIVGPRHIEFTSKETNLDKDRGELILPVVKHFLGIQTSYK